MFANKLGVKNRGDAVGALADFFGNSIGEKVIIRSSFVGPAVTGMEHWSEGLFEHLAPEDGFELLAGVGNFCILAIGSGIFPRRSTEFGVDQ